jgi:hypothetical protein
MVMSATAMELHVSDGAGGRFLSSTPRAIAVLILLMTLLGFEITNAVAEASVRPISTPVVPSSEVQPAPFHHVVPPLPVLVSRATPAVVSKPPRPRVAPEPLAHPVSPPTVHDTVATTPPPAAPEAPVAPPVPTTYGCGPALSYLAAHAAPGFRFECPGYALGHQAMTCINVAGVCPGSHLIVIGVPCSAAYMNEASNSWVLEGLRQAPIDPYGYCH